jgi:hypothetical protein
MYVSRKGKRSGVLSVYVHLSCRLSCSSQVIFTSDGETIPNPFFGVMYLGWWVRFNLKVWALARSPVPVQLDAGGTCCQHRMIVTAKLELERTRVGRMKRFRRWLYSLLIHTQFFHPISTSMNVLHQFCSISKGTQSELFMHSILSASSGSRFEWWRRN